MRADYTIQDISNVLRKVGIKENDDVFIHSNLGYYGILEGGLSADKMCALFLRAIQDVIGANGTIIVPTFSYSYCHNEVYDPIKTGTKCGMLSNYMLKFYSENRTLDPNFSVCGIGTNMEEYKGCNIHESFGKNCFWDMFMKNDGKIVCMNFDSGSTFLHFIERQNNVSYRYNKAFNGQTVVNGKYKRDYAVHYVFEGDADSPNMERVDRLCKENDICVQSELGKGTMLAFSAEQYFEFFSKLLITRPRVLCKREEGAEDES